MLILYAVASVVHNLDQRPRIIEWMRSEYLWNKVSPKEKEFLTDSSPDESLLIEFSWGIEGALMLGWCLNKVNFLPDLDRDDSGNAIEEFQKKVPEIGDSTMLFLSGLAYRNLDEIYEENLLNEMATAYFRDLMYTGKEVTTRINRSVSLERHRTLNWLRTYYEGENEVTGELWDDTDTST